jgi:hypothetical protein
MTSPSDFRQAYVCHWGVVAVGNINYDRQITLGRIACRVAVAFEGERDISHR